MSGIMQSRTRTDHDALDELQRMMADPTSWSHIGRFVTGLAKLVRETGRIDGDPAEVARDIERRREQAHLEATGAHLTSEEQVRRALADGLRVPNAMPRDPVATAAILEQARRDQRAAPITREQQMERRQRLYNEAYRASGGGGQAGVLGAPGTVEEEEMRLEREGRPPQATTLDDILVPTPAVQDIPAEIAVQLTELVRVLKRMQAPTGELKIKRMNP